jgi:RHS repeat-associated protein
LNYSYDSVTRLANVRYNSGTPFAYNYVANSNLIDTIGQGSAYLRDYDYKSDSNRLDKMKHSWSNLAASQMETRLDYDVVGRRDTEKTQGTGFMATLGRPSDPGVHVDYTYTNRSEVDSSAKYVLTSNWLPGALLAGTGRDYDYDPIGNRTADQAGAYAANGLNQYTVAPGLGGFSYDANGNLTGDGVRTYTYDSENRLITVTQGGSTWNYKYDYLDRRIAKWGTGITETRFLYDGWNLVAELDASGNITRRFVWGLDVSGSLAGAGGVGGLLVIEAGGNQYFPVYDASHNVIGLYNGSGGFAAAYEYDPFGQPQTTQGSYAVSNPFRSATKYADSETSLVYYGMRFYSAQLGRFINRDPIEEAGGVNLYAFCGNDGVNCFDYLGQDSSFLDRILNGDPKGSPWSSNVWVNSSSENVYFHINGGQKYNPNDVYGVIDPETGEQRIYDNDGRSGPRELAGSIELLKDFWAGASDFLTRDFGPNSGLLVGIDGTGSANWKTIVDGRSPNSNVFNLVHDFKGRSLYLNGPNTLGTNVGRISARALEFIHALLLENPNLVVNLVGHSRGGMIAIDIARQLKAGFADVNGGHRSE